MRDDGSTTGGDAFAAVVGRLRLTQGEVRRLMAGQGTSRNDGVLPGGGCDAERLEALTVALGEALALIADDALVARWLRSPLPRRGGASPLEEVERVEGGRLIMFVLRPHPTELVRLVADAERARLRKLPAARSRAPAHV